MLTISLDGSLLEVTKRLESIAAETEETVRQFSRTHEKQVDASRYFRFNVADALGGLVLARQRRRQKLRRRHVRNDPETVTKSQRRVAELNDCQVIALRPCFMVKLIPIVQLDTALWSLI
jgi:hypothetical protein